MKIPKYWARGTAQSINRKGETVSFSCWGWSDISEDDAERKARDRASQVLSKFVSGEELGKYSYGDRPMREKIVKKITGRGRDEVGLVTRNSYGALVLNAANAMFMDVDFAPEQLSGCLTGLFNKLRGKKTPDREEVALNEVRTWADINRDLDINVYRTFAGLRCLITNKTFDPADQRTVQMMEELKCDPLYIKLCKQQECFRARLTPKPWRIQLDQPPAKWPYETADHEHKVRQWEENYNRASSEFTVCRLVEQIGSKHIHSDIQPIVSLHDEYCLTRQNLPLA